MFRAKAFTHISEFLLGPTLEKKLARALDADNVRECICLIETHADNYEQIAAALRQGIERGRIRAFVRILAAVAGSPYELVIAPELISAALNRLVALPSLPLTPSEKVAIVCDLDRAVKHCNNRQYNDEYLATVREIPGGPWPPSPGGKLVS